MLLIGKLLVLVIHVLIFKSAACILFAVIFWRHIFLRCAFNFCEYMRIACAFLVLFRPAIESNFCYIKFHVNGSLSGGCRLVSDSLSLVLGLSII